MSDFRTSQRILSADEIDYTAEAERVQQRAGRNEPSAIRLGPLLFFSTASGDAWMIDVLDGEAACLAAAGAAQPIPIVDELKKTGIAWPSRHRFEGETFVVIGNDGATRAYHDYPNAQIRPLIDDYPAESSGAGATNSGVARKRQRQAGRNEPRPFPARQNRPDQP
jgi:hypothetical protein